jgi:hypothetical protein
MELRETSGNFEVEQLQQFLQRVKTLIDSGFTEDEILQVQRAAESMPIDSSKRLEFPIHFKGTGATLVITLFMDETEFPEVSFLTHPDLAEAIDQQMNLYFEEIVL